MPEDPTALVSRLDAADGITIETLHEALDEMDDAGRLTFVRSLDKRRQGNLWTLCHRHMEASLDMLVPEELEKGQTAVSDDSVASVVNTGATRLDECCQA